MLKNETWDIVSDLVKEEDLDRIEKRLKGINKFAPIKRCERSKVDVNDVLDLRAFDLDRTLEMDPELKNKLIKKLF